MGRLARRLFAGLALALTHGVNRVLPSAGFGRERRRWDFQRPAALLVAVSMAVAGFVRQAGDPFAERELALLYGVVALQFLLTGAGGLSLDALVAQWRGRARGARHTTGG